MTLCMKCMREFAEGTKCTHCGWLVTNKPKDLRHLPLRTKLQNGQYIVGTAIDSGSFGIVYIALDLQLKARRAIKEFYPTDLATRSPGTTTLLPVSAEASEPMKDGIALLLKEGRILADLEQATNGSSGIVRIFNAFEENKTAYLVMELLEGETLAKYLSRIPGKKIRWEEALRILEPVMASLEAAHNRGIIHLDVAADNIIVTNDSYVKLFDFGASKRLAAEASQSVALICKDGYSPPEKYVSRGNTGAWTDVYSSAATIYLAITGKTPPPAPNRQAGTELIPPRRLGAAVPYYGNKALLRALKLRESERFQTIAEFLIALRKVPTWRGLLVTLAKAAAALFLLIVLGRTLLPLFKPPAPGLYLTREISKGAPIPRDAIELKGGGAPPTDAPSSYEAELRGLCAQRDLPKRTRVRWTDIGDCAR